MNYSKMVTSLLFSFCFLACLQSFVELTLIENVKVENFLEQFSNLAKKVELLEQRLGKANIKDVFKDTAKELSSLQRLKGDNRIGFTASLTHDMTALQPQQFIPFDKVTSNLGDTYNSVTGIYTCPLDGNYFLSVTVTAAQQSSIHASITLDGIRVASAYATGAMSQGSNSAVVHCNVGQEVAVRVVKGNSIHGDMTSPLSQFTGFLIWDD